MNILEAGPAERPSILTLLAAAVLGNPDQGRFFLAMEDSEPIGVAYLSYCWTLEHGGLVGWLEELYVRPLQRDRGTGASLLEHVMRFAAGHARAELLYERHGFRNLPRRRFSRTL